MKIEACRSCGARIVWLKTKGGKAMPVDLPVKEDDEVYDQQRHLSHFATCPQANKWRKSKKAAA